jgi:anti-sigma28 factor (negative regulator of flagellin synthesis)
VVTLSSAGTAVVADADESAPSVRVEKLKMMVEQGKYEVDLETLASRIVDDDILRGTRS